MQRQEVDTSLQAVGISPQTIDPLLALALLDSDSHPQSTALIQIPLKKLETRCPRCGR